MGTVVARLCCGLLRLPCAYCLIQFQRPIGNEDEQSAQQSLLGLGRQVIAPVHHGTQRLLLWQYHAIAVGQQAEAIIQLRSDLFQRENPQARCRQLDGQRQLVQLLTNLDQRCLICFV